jgi:hypothetical protein
MGLINDQIFTRAVAITLNDTAQVRCSAIYVGGAGNLAVTTEGGDNVTLNGLTAGSLIPLACSVLKSSGSTATNILALF